MKGGHNPSRQQKKILMANGKDWNEWLIVKTNVDSFVFKHKTTNEVIELSSTLPKSKR